MGLYLTVISKSFLKSSLIYTIAGTLPMASSIILLPFYIGFLSASELGMLWIYLAFSTLIQVLVTFSFDSSIFVHFHEYKSDPDKLQQFVSSIFNLMLLIGAGVFMFFLVTGDFIFGTVYPHEEIVFFPYGLICIITAIFQSFFRVNNSYLMTSQSPEVYLFSNLLLFSLIAGFTIGGLYLFDSLIGPLGGRLVATVIAGGWAYMRVIRSNGMYLNFFLLGQSFQFNLFSFFYQLQQWLMNSFDKILLSFYLPMNQVGIYGFLTGCLIVIEFLLNGVYSSFSGKVVSILVAQSEKSTSIEINRYFYGMTALSMTLVAGFIFSFPFVVVFLPADYLQILPFIAFASLIYVFRSTRLYFGVPFGFLKYTRPLPFIYGLVSLLKIGLIVLLVGRLGLNAVILAGLLSYWLEIFLLYFWGRHKIKFHFNAFKLIIAPALLALSILVVEPWFGADYTTLVHTGYVFFCGVVLLLAFKKELRSLNLFKLING